MIHCQACGYPNDSSEHRCEKCGVRFMALGQAVGGAAAAPASLEEPQKPRVVPVWRGEISERVARFRARRGFEPSLPLKFPDQPAGKIIAFPAPTPKPPVRPRAQPRRKPDVGSLPQPLLEFPETPTVPNLQPSVDFPVAPVADRARAALADAALVAIGYVLLFAAGYLPAADLPAGRWTLLAALAGLAVLPPLYLFLFLVFTGLTPGMRLAGLRLVDFNGRPASAARRLGRVLATVASAGSFFLGFLWALFDEERLTWHDRMSETCLTKAGRQ